MKNNKYKKLILISSLIILIFIPIINSYIYNSLGWENIKNYQSGKKDLDIFHNHGIEGNSELWNYTTADSVIFNEPNLTRVGYPLIIRMIDNPYVYNALQGLNESFIRILYYNVSNQWVEVPFQIDEKGWPLIWADGDYNIGTYDPVLRIKHTYVSKNGTYNYEPSNGNDTQVPYAIDYDDEICFYVENGQWVSNQTWWNHENFPYRLAVNITDPVDGGQSFMYIYYNNHTPQVSPEYESYVNWDSETLTITTQIYQKRFKNDDPDIMNLLRILAPGSDGKNIIEEMDNSFAGIHVRVVGPLGINFYGDMDWMTHGSWNETYYDDSACGIDNPNEETEQLAQPDPGNIPSWNEWDTQGDHLAVVNGPIRVILLKQRYTHGMVSLGGLAGNQHIYTYDLLSHIFYNNMEQDDKGSMKIIVPTAPVGTAYIDNTCLIIETIGFNVSLREDFANVLGGNPGGYPGYNETEDWNPDYPNNVTDSQKYLYFNGNDIDDDLKNGGDPTTDPPTPPPIDNEGLSDWTITCSETHGGMWMYIPRKEFLTAIEPYRAGGAREYMYYQDDVSSSEIGYGVFNLNAQQGDIIATDPYYIRYVYGIFDNVSNVERAKLEYRRYKTDLSNPDVSPICYQEQTCIQNHTGTIELDAETYYGTAAVAEITLIDQDLDTTDNVNTAYVNVTSSRDQWGIRVFLTETGPNTGIFKGIVMFSTTGSDDPSDIIWVKDGDTIIVRYDDEHTMTGDPASLTDTAIWIGTYTGTIELNKAEYIDDEIPIVTIIDPDLNQNPNIKETVSISVISDSDPIGISVILTETEKNNGGFEGYFSFNRFLSNDTLDQIYIFDEDNVIVTYYDQHSLTGAQLNITDTATWHATHSGTIELDKEIYYGTGAVAMVTINDTDLNTNINLKETVSLRVWSDTVLSYLEPGIFVNCLETGITTGIFIGYFTFSTVESDDILDKIWVDDGDTIYVGMDNYLCVYPPPCSDTAIWRNSNITPGMPILELILNPDNLLVDKQSSLEQSMDLTLIVSWPYDSTWEGTLMSSQIFDFIIELNGNKIWQWSDDYLFLQWITTITIPPYGSRVYTVTWDFLPDEIEYEGIYTARAFFIASGQEISKDFEIKFTPNIPPPTYPQLENLTESADPLELGQTETIQIDAFDIDGISMVCIGLDSGNYTMNNIGGNKYEFSWVPTDIGVKPYSIYAVDTQGYWSCLYDSITVQDTTFTGTIELDQGEYYGTAATPIITLTDSELDTTSSADLVNVHVTSNSDSSGIMVICTETGINTGIFTGTFSFSTISSNDLSDIILAYNNDIITVSYCNASDNATWIQTHTAEMPKPPMEDHFYGLTQYNVIIIDDEDMDFTPGPYNDQIKGLIISSSDLTGFTADFIEMGTPGVFGFVFGFTFGSTNDRFLHVEDGDTIEIIYFDQHNDQGYSDYLRESAIWHRTYNGSLSINTTLIIGYNSVLEITVSDKDLDIDNLNPDYYPAPFSPVEVQTKDNFTNYIRIALTETGLSTGIFKGFLYLGAGPTNILNQTLNVLDNENIVIRYSEAHNIYGDPELHEELVRFLVCHNAIINTDRDIYYGDFINVIVTVRDEDLNLDSNLQECITINASNGPNNMINVELHEQGIDSDFFIGIFTLVTNSTSDVDDLLHVNDGDVIIISCLDEMDRFGDTVIRSINITWYFTLDDLRPLIILNTPQNQTIIKKPAYLNLTVIDDHLISSSVNWRANVNQTYWTNSFIGSYDIDLSSFVTDQTVQFWVRARDTFDNQNEITIILTFDDTPPTKPSSPEFLIQTGNLTLSWNSSLDNNSIYYQVWRNGHYLGNTTSIFYTDSECLAPGTYIYEIIPFDEANNEGESLIIEIIIPKPRNPKSSRLFPIQNGNNFFIFLIVIGLVSAIVSSISIIKKRNKKTTSKGNQDSRNRRIQHSEKSDIEELLKIEKKEKKELKKFSKLFKNTFKL